MAPGMTARTKVLVVDDHDVNLLLARHTLEDAGYEVVLAANGMEALARFVEQPADCVLLDVRMPDIDGFAVCERLRSLPGGAEMPVLFLTALRDVETFDRASRVDADDFLTKPVRPQELVARVRTAIELRRVRAELREHYGLLKKQRDDLMRLQLQKERLMAFVVHDLKNPVHTMDLHAQLLLLEELPADAREAVLHIRAGARRLSQMILNLLDVSKADEGRLVPQRSEVDLVGLIADVLAETDAFLAQLPPGHLVTWNGAGFDFPFVWDRAIAAGVALDLYLSPDPGILLPHGPPAGHRLAYRVRWGAHGHIDAYLELRATAHRVAGSARLKSFAALHGIDCLEHDYARLPSLSAAALERYVASDARATLHLAERYGLTGSLVGAP